MCMTVGDSTWAFVLAATEILESHRATAHVTSFKIPLRILLCHGSLWNYKGTRADTEMYRLTLQTHRTMKTADRLKCSTMIAFTLVSTTFKCLGLSRCV